MESWSKAVPAWLMLNVVARSPAGSLDDLEEALEAVATRRSFRVDLLELPVVPVSQPWSPAVLPSTTLQDLHSLQRLQRPEKLSFPLETPKLTGI